MKTLQDTIIELWHISRTALACSNSSRYDRMIYVKKSLKDHYPSLISKLNSKQLWFEIEDVLSHKVIS